jgi:hypothetical protein
MGLRTPRERFEHALAAYDASLNLDTLPVLRQRIVDEYTFLELEIARLREALSKYADEENWTIQSDDGSEPDLWHGFGAGPSIAMKALNPPQPPEVK